MANRRMFSRSIIKTDKFLEMPVSSRELYFQLGMEADDDGFVSSPKSIMKSIGAEEDNLKLLIAKGFIIPFETGVIVISNWRENNYIQSDRYNPTKYQNELKMLKCEENVYTLDTQVRLGKVRLGKVKNTLAKKTAEMTEEVTENNLVKEIPKIINLFKDISPTSYKDWFNNITERSAAEKLSAKFPAEELEMLIRDFLPKLNVMPYVGKDCKAFKPSELLRNMDKIITKIKELQLKDQNNKPNAVKI